LPRGLDGVRVVMPPDEGNSVPWGDSVDNGEAGQRCAGPAHSAAAADLHPFGQRVVPGFEQAVRACAGSVGSRRSGQATQRACQATAAGGGARSRYTAKAGPGPGGQGCRRLRPLTSRPEGSLSTPAATGSHELATRPTVGECNRRQHPPAIRKAAHATTPAALHKRMSWRAGAGLGFERSRRRGTAGFRDETLGPPSTPAARCRRVVTPERDMDSSRPWRSDGRTAGGHAQ
jgi:hypothetical protein